MHFVSPEAMAFFGMDQSQIGGSPTKYLQDVDVGRSSTRSTPDHRSKTPWRRHRATGGLSNCSMFERQELLSCADHAVTIARVSVSAVQMSICGPSPLQLRITAERHSQFLRLYL